MKTSELTGAALDWAVAKCEGITWEQGDLDAGEYGPGFKPSTDWAQGGPIIEKERLHLIPLVNTLYADRQWECSTIVPDVGDSVWALGPTPLIAAMRCYVASKLGEELNANGGTE